jgi:flagellar hook protein FlgE
MSISALNIGVSALQANLRALDSASHNIANANTTGFQPQQASFQEQKNGGVIVNISQASRIDSGGDASGTDLATEIVNTIEYKAGFDLSAKLVKTSNELLGTLIDISA